MMAAAGAAAALSGFTALALALPKHQRDVMGKTLPVRRERMLRTGGWILIALSLMLDMLGWGASLGIVYWFGSATLAALLVALGICYWPRAVTPVAVLALLLSLGAAALGAAG